MQIVVYADDQPWVAELREALHAAGIPSRLVCARPLPLDPDALRQTQAMIIDSAPSHKTCVDLCARLRNEFRLDTPIMVIGAVDSLDNKLNAFAAGCDDYLVRPFDPQELLARLRSIWRRQQQSAPVAAVLRVADLEHHPGTCETQRAGRRIKLGPISRRLLHLLLRESPRVVSRERLEFEIWGASVPERDLLRSHISMLRKAVDQPHAVKLIHTVHGTGFRLIG